MVFTFVCKLSLGGGAEKKYPTSSGGGGGRKIIKAKNLDIHSLPPNP